MSLAALSCCQQTMVLCLMSVVIFTLVLQLFDFLVIVCKFIKSKIKKRGDKN